MPFEYGAELLQICRRVRRASRQLAMIPSIQKNRCIEKIIDLIDASVEEILEANNLDVDHARKKGLEESYINRLKLSPKRIRDITNSLRTIIGLPDPVGRIDSTWIRPNGLKIDRCRVPIGVIFLIFESRPQVSIAAGVLGLKAGNAIILRGSSNCFNTNKILVDIMRKALKEEEFPSDSMHLIPWSDREVIRQLITMNRYIDLVIPRGGKGLEDFVTSHATVPVIRNSQGLCHIYVDADASFDKAEKIILNAKCQKPDRCNSVETLLVHKDIAAEFVPHICKLFAEHKVKIKGCETVCSLCPNAETASKDDWKAEYLDKEIAIRVMNSMEAAVDHINSYNTGYSEAIITENKPTATKFCTMTDSAVIYVNASTRLTDGSQFGMGAEIGISTDRIHARGPMGIDELTIYKYIAVGNGQIRE